jgi:haloalkane dehalogenase
VALAGGLRLAYRELGSGPPVLLLHGWPTSSLLWRGVMPAIARANRVLALDLPGFGGSDKPLDTDYGYGFYERALDGFLDALRIERFGLAVHDIGGPIGVRWAIARSGRVTRLALLNTLLYPDLLAGSDEFEAMLRTPERRDRLTSPDGLATVMRRGVVNRANVTDEVLAGVRAPFATEAARQALVRAGLGLEPEVYAEIAASLPSLAIPVRIVYGEQDRFLPDVARTMARVERDVPQAEVTALPAGGHFVQEDAAGQVGELLAAFFAVTEPRRWPGTPAAPR